MTNPTYEPVQKGGLGAEIINYFHVTNAKQEGAGAIPRTINDFLQDCIHLYSAKYPDLGWEIRRFIQNLINEAVLYSVGFDPDLRLPLSERLMSYGFDERLAEYGSYDFAAFGKPEVRKQFKGSVLPILVRQEVKEEDGTCSLKEKTGTCFVVDKCRLVTAQHCLPKGATISIPGWNPTQVPLLTIRTSGVEDEVPPFKRAGSLDLAVLQFESDPFPDAKKLGLWTGHELHDVLCMGFPKMKGFDSGVLVTETGEIVADEYSIITKQQYLIFNARVKVGNSGGPILNRLGKVVGVVTEGEVEDAKASPPLAPAATSGRGGPTSNDEPEILGYGLATPAPKLFDLLKQCDSNSPELYKIRFSTLGGIRILS